jgi:hypothetical protein
MGTAGELVLPVLLVLAGRAALLRWVCRLSMWWSWWRSATLRRLHSQQHVFWVRY